MTERSLVWGVPLAPFTRAQAVDRVEALIANRKPAFFITANLHYAMLTAEVPGLAAVNTRADFILADGAPLVVASRRTDRPVPERVAGSDLIYDIAERAAERGHRLYLLGGLPGIAEEAGRRLKSRYPGLQVVGTTCPTSEELTEPQVAAVIDQIRTAQPDILFVALGQPKGEFWINRHLQALGVPVVAQVGATLDFVAGRVQRAPRIFQRTGLEWAFRIYTDPRRLAPRYWRNARFLATRLIGDRLRRSRATVDQPSPGMAVSSTNEAHVSS